MQQKPVSAERIARLMERHGRALVYFASQWTAAAEDCVQEAFVELARQRVEPQRVTAWLFRVVRNRALNAARAESRRQHHERAAAAERHSSAAGKIDDDSRDLLAAVEQLDAPAREVVALRVWSGLGWEEIARVLGTSSSTAHRRYVAALERLREMLEEPCPTKKNQSKTSPCAES